jgi:prolyl-tRNA synthetase
MRLSQTFIRTLREDPADAEVPSHRLLLRGSFIHPVMSGVFTTLPLGLRSMGKIEAIIREEMDAAGAVETRMPIILPAEPWKATGRWEAYGDTMFKLTDRHDRELGLGPTQEEVVTPLVTATCPSYRDLPLNLYQIGWKYRDEFRPRFGLLRGREFLMKDAYSFDRDDAAMHGSYAAMMEAYDRIFARCGLRFVVVEADPGTIGGGTNHEFMAVSEVGEDLYVSCPNGDYLADIEAATPGMPEVTESDPGSLAPLTQVSTPGAETIEKVAAVLGCAAEQTLKTILFVTGEQVVAALVPGDRAVNETKLERRFFPEPIRTFTDADFETHGYAKGYVGPQGLGDDVLILADHGVRAGRDWITGANVDEMHVTGANAGRDFRVDEYTDLVAIRESDACPSCGAPLVIERSIVVGHTYELGDRYSRPLQATFADEDGSDRHYLMGCYGIGISRILAAVVEQRHDDDGIVWPRAVAPFEVVVIRASDDEPTVEAASRLYETLQRARVDVALDDRDDRAGAKFADADLIGYPLQVVVGKRGIEAGTVDLKVRATGERAAAPIEDALEHILELLTTTA